LHDAFEGSLFGITLDTKRLLIALLCRPSVMGARSSDMVCDTRRPAQREETDMAEHLVGTVSHYYGNLGVAGIELSSELNVGDTIHILGHTSDFIQTVGSIQIKHETVESAKAGEPIGVKVNERARVNDQVLVVTPD